MLVLEAAAALWFWAQAVSLLLVPSTQPPFLKTVYAAEEAWHSGQSAWLDEAEGLRVSREFRKKTGCCVAFILGDGGDGEVGFGGPGAGFTGSPACPSKTRIVQRKTLYDAGLRSGLVVAGCG